ncbi:MAG: DUF5752 family protein [Candidatus Muirbacterium halophilum]|nr:DUF5752 family protein [Candidatus Muirbacterium halophilum]MCK9474373.1 DUF5752 family protein [Candidatus Muirbacterium halophilum]
MIKETPAFNVKDCALVAIATGKKAHNLRELKDIIQNIDQGSIYYHFWGMLLKPRFMDSEYNNEFALWVKSSLHDSILAERLSVVDPTDFGLLDELRNELVDTIQERLDEDEWINFVRPQNKFHFKKSHIVVFDTNIALKDPSKFSEVIKEMSTSSIFYHFIDARRRTKDNVDDFRQWLMGLDGKYNPICDKISSLDPYFVSLNTLKEQLVNIFDDFFKGGKINE